MSSRLSSAPKSRAAALGAVLALAGLAGCSSEGGGEWRGMLNIVRTSWEHSDGAIRLSDAASVPYASLGVRLGGDSERLLVLATDDNGLRLWTSAARVALTTRRGRIVSTAGLPHDLTGFSSETAFQAPPANARRFSWLADFADLGLYSIEVDCEDVPAGNESIVILGKELSTTRVDEKCRSSQIDWNFTNTFWVSRASNRIWRSIQYVHPKFDPLEIELLRPPQTPD